VREPLVETLFDDFARRYRRGEQPDVRDYLARAGTESEDLARMLDVFLQAAPAREPTEEDLVLMQARLEQEPPLLLLRQRRKLKRGAVVDALVAALGLDPAKREKVDGYYHRLETGLLDPKPVSSRVWDALTEFMAANVRALAGLRPPRPAAAAHYRRADWALELHEHIGPPLDYATMEPVDGDAIAEPSVDQPDEIDRLFTAGP
jgi:hypothetical protein